MVLGLFLSDDVLDAGVQEHVLVLKKRKGGLESGFWRRPPGYRTNSAVCLKRS